MRIRIFLDMDTELEECPAHEFDVVPRTGDVLCLPSGNQYNVKEVMWSLPECEPAYPVLTVSIKHLETDQK